MTGPVFIAGRQHSGNTLAAMMLGRSPDCLAQIDESSFFERVDRIGALSGAARAEAVLDAIKLEAKEHAAEARAWALEHQSLDPVPLYAGVMARVCALAGRRVWAQKATSYIFHARQVLEAMPDARLIYMLRNPFDLAASEKKRRWMRGYVWGTPAGWNSGLRRAEAASRAFPGRLLIVKYEELVSGTGVEAMFEFAGVRLTPACLDVPWINKAEAGAYTLTGDGTRGLTGAKVCAYVGTLTKPQMAAVDLVADRALVDRYYPGLPHREKGFLRPWHRLTGAALAVAAPVAFATTYLTRIRRTPRELVSRTLKRLG